MGEHQKPGALLRRIAPSVPLELTVPDDASGKSTTKSFRLSFDMNAAAAIEERSETTRAIGIRLTDLSIWTNVGPKFIRVMFWGALLANHPEYDNDEGLKVIGSYLDDTNTVAVVEALWQAYLNWLPPETRQVLIEAREKPEDADPQQPPEKESPAAKKETPTVGVGPSSGRQRAMTSGSQTKSSAASPGTS